MNETILKTNDNDQIVWFVCAITFNPTYMEVVQKDLIKYLKTIGAPSILLNDSTEEYVTFLLGQFLSEPIKDEQEVRALLRDWIDKITLKSTVVVHNINDYTFAQ